MKQLYLFRTTLAVMVFTLAFAAVQAQTTYTWDGSSSNEWTTAANWTPDRTTPATNDILVVQTGSTLTITVSLSANQTIGQLQVKGNTNLTLQKTSTARILTISATSIGLDIEGNSSLTINTGISVTIANSSVMTVANNAILSINTTRVLTFAASSTASILGTVNVSGTLNVSGSNQVITIGNGGVINMQPSGVVSPTAASQLVFQVGSTFGVKRTSGTIPLATWDPNSLMLVDLPAGTGDLSCSSTQTFGKIEWNSPNQDNTICLGLNTGNNSCSEFKVVSTGAGAMSFFAATSRRIQVQGDFLVQGTSKAQIVTHATAVCSLQLAGNVKLAATATLERGTSSGTQRLIFNNAGVEKYFECPGASFNAAGISIDIDATAGAIVALKNNIDMPTSGTKFTVGGTATLKMGAYELTGAADFTLSNNSTLHIGHADGISTSGAAGNVQVTGTIIFNVGANYTYDGTAAQITGDGLPASVLKLTINNNHAGGVTMTRAGTTAISNNLALTYGKLYLTGASALSVAGNFTGTFSGNTMVCTNGSGTVSKNIASGYTTPITFPIGDGIVYSPVTITFVTNVNAGSVAARVEDASHTQLNNPSAPPGYLSRRWPLLAFLGTGDYTYNISFGYGAADITGAESNLKIAYYNSGWVSMPTSAGSNVMSSTATYTKATAPLNISNAEVVYTGRGTGPPPRYYRTIASNNWSNVNTWESADDAGFTINVASPAGATPDAGNSLGIAIRNGHDVTVTTDVSADQLTIDDDVANSTLIINSGVVFTLENGAGDDLTLAGANSRLNVNGKLVNEGVITGSTTSTTQVSATGEYQHDVNGGVILPATWNAASLCNVTGIASAAPTGISGITFGKFTWNCPGMSSFVDLNLTALTTFAGDFTLVSTGSPTAYTLYLASSSSGDISFGASAAAPADFIVQGGDICLLQGGANNDVTLYGSYNQSGGTVKGGAGTGAVIFTFANTLSDKTFTQTAGTITNTNRISFNVNNGAARLTLLNDFPYAGSGRIMTVNGTLYMGDKIVSGQGNIQVSAGATLGVGHAQGISKTGATGNIQVDGARNYQNGSNYVYNGGVAQITGDGLPSEDTYGNLVNNLTIDNAAGVTLAFSSGTSADVYIEGTLTLINGDFQIGGSSGNLNTLKLRGPAIAGTSANLKSTQYSNLNFVGAGANGNTGLFIPSSINTLNALYISIQGTNQVTMNGSITLQSAGTGLTLAAGRLVLGNNDLTILSTNAASGISITSPGDLKMVVADGSGYLKRAIPAGLSGTNSYLFPVGDLSGTAPVNNSGADYSPVALNFTSTDIYRIIGIRVVDAKHPNDGTVTNYISRYWTMSDSEAGNGTYTYDGTYQYSVNNPSDFVGGSYASLDLHRWDGLAWTGFAASTTPSTNTVAMTGLTETTGPLDGNDYYARALITGAVFTWQGTVDDNWNNPVNWIPADYPNLCDRSAIIPAGTLFSPRIYLTDITIHNMDIAAGAVLTLEGKNLNVCGDWSGGDLGNAVISGTGTVHLNSATDAQTISGKTKFEFLQVKNSDGVSLAGGANVSINKGLHLEAGNLNVSSGTLRLLSATASHAAYIDNFSFGATPGTITGTAYIDRFVPHPGRNQHFISSPVNNTPLSQIGASGPNNSYITPTLDCSKMQSSYGSAYGTVFAYDDIRTPASSCAMANWKIQSAGNMVNAKGYSAYLTGNSILTVSGTPNTGDINVAGVSSTTTYMNIAPLNEPIESGWNLVGNPYPSTIALNSNDNDHSGFDDQIQVWKTSGPFSGSWQQLDMSAGAVIAPFQAFMVHRNSAGTAPFHFYQSERTRATNTTFYRTDAENSLTLEANYNGSKDVTRINFSAAATNGFDSRYDANKPGGDIDRPTLYTHLNTNMWYATNTLPSLQQATAVPMGLAGQFSGTMSITAQGISTFDPTTYIFLEDKKTGAWHNLRGGAYTFTKTSTENQDRFAVHFTPPAQILITDASCSGSGLIQIEQPGSANWNYVITDNNNTAISGGTLNSSAPITVNVNTGVYILTLTDNNGYVVMKNIEVKGEQYIFASFTVSGDLVTTDEEVFFQITTPDATAQMWDFGDGSISTAASPAHKFAAEGIYLVTLTVHNEQGCVSTTTQTITVTSKTATSFSKASGGDSITIWSSENRVYIDFSKQKQVWAEIEFYNLLGQVIHKERFARSVVYTKEIPNPETAYLLVSVHNKDNTITKKVLINKVK